MVFCVMNRVWHVAPMEMPAATPRIPCPCAFLREITTTLADGRAGRHGTEGSGAYAKRCHLGMILAVPR